MKRKCLITLCAAALGCASTTSTFAAVEPDPAAVAADAVLGRPLCFATTVVGAALFVVTLPVAATSKSIGSTAEALVLKPGRATFTRPLGDFSYTQPQTTEGQVARRENKL